MKNFLFIALLLTLGLFANAQNVNVSPNIYTGQMLNPAKTYGTKADTATNTTALPLHVVRVNSAATKGYNTPIVVDGHLSFLASCTKITGTLTGTVSLEQSFDSTTWAPYTVINSADTGMIPLSYAITDVSTTQLVTFNLPSIPAAPYWRVVYRGVGTATSRWLAYVCVKKSTK
jgi:hypothetical protein